MQAKRLEEFKERMQRAIEAYEDAGRFLRSQLMSRKKPELIIAKPWSSQAIGIILVGLVIMIGGSIGAALLFGHSTSGLFGGKTFVPNLYAGISVFFIGAIVVAYGAHLWIKITHIMWTRQALREYGVPSFDVKQGDIEEIVTKDVESEELEEIIDNLDVRLAKGEISEVTYKELRTKFEKKKMELKRERKEEEKENAEARAGEVGEKT